MRMTMFVVRYVFPFLVLVGLTVPVMNHFKLDAMYRVSLFLIITGVALAVGRFFDPPKPEAFAAAKSAPPASPPVSPSTAPAQVPPPQIGPPVTAPPQESAPHRVPHKRDKESHVTDDKTPPKKGGNANVTGGDNGANDVHLDGVEVQGGHGPGGGGDANVRGGNGGPNGPGAGVTIIGGTIKGGDAK